VIVANAQLNSSGLQQLQRIVGADLNAAHQRLRAGRSG
jgi:hypothetical protein